MTDLRWGIMGTGGIAAVMAQTLRDEGSEVVAVGSARPDAADRFAREWDIPIAVESHRAVADVHDVDIVYVATTNDRHHQNVLDCVERGKPVLCEKPIALNHQQADEMFREARAAGVFVMEALWMRFLPFVEVVDDLIASGSIGEIRHVQASFSYRAATDPDRRWMNAAMGGGALLDLGVYPLSLTHHLLGPPLNFSASAQLGETGVDIATRVMSDHRNQTSASVFTSFVADTADDAVIAGTDGRIRVHARMHESRRVTVERGSEIIDSIDTSFAGHGFRFEVAETERCVMAGLLESPLRPPAHTLEVMNWMDAIRAGAGIEFPREAR